MPIPKFYVSIILLITSGLTFGQELYQPKPDSVVRLVNEDYNGDTIAKRSIEIKKFHRGNLVSAVAIVMSKKADVNWIDSVVTESYFKQGKPVKTSVRNYSYYECVKYPLYPPGFEIGSDPKTLRAQAQPTVYLCPTIYLTEKLHLDSMTVTETKNLTNTSEPHTHDTLIYCFKNRFFKYHSEYRDTQRISSRRRDYIFDKTGELVVFINTFYHGDQAWKQEEKVKVSGVDTLSLIQSSVEKRDTVMILFESKRTYHENRQVSFVSFENEVEKYRIKSSYYPDGLIKENYTWRDSLPDQIEKYSWKRSKGKLECWSSQDYKHSSDYSGNYYALTDTSYSKGKMIVSRYGTKIKEDVSLMPAQNLTEENLYQQSEYDDKGRLLLVRSFDSDTGKLSSVMKWEYWRE